MKIVEFLLARLGEDEEAASHGDGGLLDHEDAHFTRERVLAECEAKRFMLSLHPDVPSINSDQSTVLRRFACVYADHPDFQERWRN